MGLLVELRKKDKKGLFVPTQTSVSYSTGFLPLDYKNGFLLDVYDGEIIVDSYPSIGLVGGTFFTIVGKSATAKTTVALQIIGNIVKKFGPDSFGIIYDLEQSLTYTRIKNLVPGIPMKELRDKIILRQEKNYIEDIFASVNLIANEKENNKEQYMYDTGLKNEFNENIKAYVPTFILIDSIPTLSTNKVDSSTEMEGSTYSNRMAKELSQFYKKLMPVIKTYNITVIAINHIKLKMDINPMMKSQAQVMYLKQDESLPGGVAPIYYAHNILKIVTTGKLLKEDVGFDGFSARFEFIKSRTNKAGQFVNMIYDQMLGYDSTLSLLSYCESKGLVEGRNPYRRFIGFEDVKFDSRKFREEVASRKEVFMAMMEASLPVLSQELSHVQEEETDYELSYEEMEKAAAPLVEKILA